MKKKNDSNITPQTFLQTAENGGGRKILDDYAGTQGTARNFD